MNFQKIRRGLIGVESVQLVEYIDYGTHKYTCQNLRGKKEKNDHMSKTLFCKKNYSHPIGYSKFWRFFSPQIIVTQLFCNKNFFFKIKGIIIVIHLTKKRKFKHKKGNVLGD